MSGLQARRTLHCLAIWPLFQACVHPPEPVARPRESAVVFEETCDGSGAIALSDRLLVVASDEDNVLRTYDVERGGRPLAATDMSSALDLPLKGKARPTAPEMDLEAATRIGDRAYWLTSHGRSSGGKLRPERHRLFSTHTSTAGMSLAGRPYDQLLADMLAAPALAGFQLSQAAKLPPKAPGGLNIEGLTATPSGELLIAFRNPIPDGRALLVPLLNPTEILEGADGVRARFGAPVLLDLDGYGVRALSWWQGRYLIMAGHYASGRRSRLYEWKGHGQPRLVSIDLEDLNAEGFFTPEKRAEILILSDDGERIVDGVACKDLRETAKKTFRGLWVRPP